MFNFADVPFGGVFFLIAIIGTWIHLYQEGHSRQAAYDQDLAKWAANQSKGIAPSRPGAWWTLPLVGTVIFGGLFLLGMF